METHYNYNGSRLYDQTLAATLDELHARARRSRRWVCFFVQHALKVKPGHRLCGGHLKRQPYGTFLCMTPFYVLRATRFTRNSLLTTLPAQENPTTQFLKWFNKYAVPKDLFLNFCSDNMVSDKLQKANRGTQPVATLLRCDPRHTLCTDIFRTKVSEWQRTQTEFSVECFARMDRCT